MVKIIVEGKQSLKEKSIVATCENCGTYFSYTKSDFVSEDEIKCPWCGKFIKK